MYFTGYGPRAGVSALVLQRTCHVCDPEQIFLCLVWFPFQYFSALLLSLVGTVRGDRSQQEFAEYLLLIPSGRGSEPCSQHVLVALDWVPRVSHFLQIQEEHLSPGHCSTWEAVTPFSARFLSSTHFFFSGDCFFIHIHRYLQVPFTQAHTERAFMKLYFSALSQFIQLFKTLRTSKMK